MTEIHLQSCHFAVEGESGESIVTPSLREEVELVPEVLAFRHLYAVEGEQISDPPLAVRWIEALAVVLSLQVLPAVFGNPQEVGEVAETTTSSRELQATKPTLVMQWTEYGIARNQRALRHEEKASIQRITSSRGSTMNGRPTKRVEESRETNGPILFTCALAPIRHTHFDWLSVVIWKSSQLSE